VCCEGRSPPTNLSFINYLPTRAPGSRLAARLFPTAARLSRSAGPGYTLFELQRRAAPPPTAPHNPSLQLRSRDRRAALETCVNACKTEALSPGLRPSVSSFCARTFTRLAARTPVPDRCDRVRATVRVTFFAPSSISITPLTIHDKLIHASLPTSRLSAACCRLPLVLPSDRCRKARLEYTVSAA